MGNNKDFNIEKRIKEDNRKDPAIIYSYEDKFARRGDKYRAIDDELCVTEDDDESDTTDNKSTIFSFILDILLDLIDI